FFVEVVTTGFALDHLAGGIYVVVLCVLYLDAHSAEESFQQVQLPVHKHTCCDGRRSVNLPRDGKPPSRRYLVHVSSQLWCVEMESKLPRYDTRRFRFLVSIGRR